MDDRGRKPGISSGRPRFPRQKIPWIFQASRRGVEAVSADPIQPVAKCR
jgi:hypothetical protein